MNNDKMLTIDFETVDPYIGLGLGSGWVYSVHHGESSGFKVLGAAVKYPDGKSEYITDHDKILNTVTCYGTLLMHDAQYDLGCLRALGLDVTFFSVLDTKVMAQLYNSSLPMYSLDALSARYTDVPKLEHVLTDAIFKHGLYPMLKREEADKVRAEKAGKLYVRKRPNEAKLVKWAKTNMDIVQDNSLSVMEEYAEGDVNATFALHEFFKDKIDMKQASFYSELSQVCLDYREKGVRVDLNKIREIRDKIVPIAKEKFNAIYKIAGEEFNVGSSRETATVFDKLDIKYGLTAVGNPSITTPWLERQPHELCRAIIEARKVLKVDRDFLKKLLDIQEYTCPEGTDYGRVFPELSLFGARTGRMSCRGPNIQQIPSRDSELGPLCRSVFVPEEGTKWYSLDYSNQEGRLQVHYAYLLKCKGASELKKAFDDNPKLDMHQMIADMAGIDRTHAKTINLGLSYGMGLNLLAKKLGVTVPEAKKLKAKYNKLVPFLNELNKKCQSIMTERGSIKTLGGRQSHNEVIFAEGVAPRDFSYKALNKLIQGSAADQIMMAMYMAWKANIPVVFPVHDELNMCGDLDSAEELATIMLTAYKLTVPMVAEVGEGGRSWAEAK